MSFCKDCIKGVTHEGTPTGKWETLNGVETYVATPEVDYPKDKAVLFMTDIFGPQLINIQLLADDYARNGFKVYVPDILNGDPVPADALFGDTGFSLPKWFKNHGPDQTTPTVEKAIAALKAQGIKDIGACGFCFGARYCFNLAFAGELKAVVVSHPSLLQIADFEKYSKTGVPLLVNSCEFDDLFTDELRDECDRVLGGGKYAPGYERTYFEGCTHGFSVRGDLSDPKVLAGKEGAFKASIQWLLKYLSPVATSNLTKSCPTVLPSMVGAGAGFEIPPVVGQAPILPGGHPEQTSLTDEVFTMVTRMSLPEGTGTLQPSSATPKTSPIAILQRELSESKESQVHLKSELSEAREALEIAKVEAFSERRKHILVQRELQAHKDEVARLQERIGQLEIFTTRLVGENSGYSVLSSARELVFEGESADAALVSAIKEAASTPGSAWAQILLGVIGPRTQEEYISAINLCLITRRALKDNKKITKYWKGLALDDGNHSDAITPSPSDISSIHDVLSEERQNAVKALLESRKKLGGSIGLLQRPRSATEDVKSKTLSRIVEPSSSARSLPSDTSSRLDNSKSEPALPPLASQVFKEELMASHSSRKHLRTSSRSSGSLAVTVSTSSMTGIMHQSSGSLEDWSFVDATLGDTGVSNSSSGPDSFTDILTAQLLSADVRINNDLREEKVSRARLSGGPLPFDNSAFAQLTGDFPAHLPNASTESSMSRGHGPDAQEDSDDGLLEAARALSSFERICAAIRSGSELGSLETISERTEPETESERGISRQPSLSPANGHAQKPPLPLKSILKNSHSSCPPTTPLPEPPTTKIVSVATERDTNKPTSKLPAPRKSLIPRTSNGNLASKSTSTRSDSKPPLTAKSPQAMELSKSARPTSDAKKAKVQQTVRIAKNSSSKASRKSSDKENNGGTNVISKGKKVIRGIHRAVA